MREAVVKVCIDRVDTAHVIVLDPSGKEGGVALQFNDDLQIRLPSRQDALLLGRRIQQVLGENQGAAMDRSAGHVVRAAREQAGLSQEELASRLDDMDQAALSRLEQGTHSPTVRTLTKIAAALNRMLVVSLADPEKGSTA